MSYLKAIQNSCSVLCRTILKIVCACGKKLHIGKIHFKKACKKVCVLLKNVEICARRGKTTTILNGLIRNILLGCNRCVLVTWFTCRISLQAMKCFRTFTHFCEFSFANTSRVMKNGLNKEAHKPKNFPMKGSYISGLEFTKDFFFAKFTCPNRFT